MKSWMHVAFAAGVLALGAVPVEANPWKDKGALGPHLWPAGTKITVYVQKDPDAPPGQPGREEQAKEGILRANDLQSFKDKGISVDVQDGSPPAGAQNAIGLTWQAGPSVPGQPNSNGRNDPKWKNDPKTGTTTTTGGTITLRTDKDGNGEILEGDMVGIVALHEFLHNAGVDHVDDPNDVMFGSPQKGGTKATEKELQAIYNAGQAKIELKTTIEDLGLSRFRYSYEATWLAGTELALFDVVVGNATVWDIEAPFGWDVGPRPLPHDVNALYVGTEPRLNVLSFQLSDSTRYLGAENPVLSFSFMANQPAGRRPIWLADLGSALAPVPELPAWTMLILGFGMIGRAVRTKAAVVSAQR